MNSSHEAELAPAGDAIANPERTPNPGGRIKRMLFGAPLEISDDKIFHRLSLVPFLAWVGLGADGLSSSSYGPDEAFRQIGQHTYLAVGLAALILFTIIIISLAYSRIIECFPTGGGGYIVASRLISEKAGLISGCALIVDYVLTITVSIAASGDALFSFLPLHYVVLKFPLEIFFIVGLTVLNIRGVKESVMFLLPIFLLFLVMHVILIAGSLGMNISHAPAVAASVTQGFHHGLAMPGFGFAGMLLLFVRAYSLGGGTFTGIEAVSNGLTIMREPRIKTGKRTMFYMASSLGFCASGLLICYLLLQIHPAEGKTMNAVLAEMFAQRLGWPASFAVVTLITEGALLIVAAQAGFIDGPRVLANMAIDSWFPRQFAALSDRLTTQNGILLMSGGALAALLYTHGDVGHLVVMYSINVFLTFSLSMFGMLKMYTLHRNEHPNWKPRALLFFVGFLLCITILCITVYEKFTEGGWITLLVTGALIALCIAIRRHYNGLAHKLRGFNQIFEAPELEPSASEEPMPAPCPGQPTAAVLVGGYGGTGIHMVYNILRMFPNHYKNMIFVSVGQLDSGKFKGRDELETLRNNTELHLSRYIDFANRLGLCAEAHFGISADVVCEAERQCLAIAEKYPNVTFFAGQVIFRKESWFHRLLHNRTAFDIQKRLHFNRHTMVILPMRVQ